VIRIVDLKTRLLNTPPRDLSGATASDRFAYQRTWALCHLLELHISGQDYVVIFDHHEDVSVLDAEEQPTSLKGYQIKTKDNGGFTVNALLKREPGAGNAADSAAAACFPPQTHDCGSLLQRRAGAAGDFRAPVRVAGGTLPGGLDCRSLDLFCR